MSAENENEASVRAWLDSWVSISGENKKTPSDGVTIEQGPGQSEEMKSDGKAGWIEVTAAAQSPWGQQVESIACYPSPSHPDPPWSLCRSSLNNKILTDFTDLHLLYILHARTLILKWSSDYLMPLKTFSFF